MTSDLLYAALSNK